MQLRIYAAVSALGVTAFTGVVRADTLDQSNRPPYGDNDDPPVVVAAFSDGALSQTFTTEVMSLIRATVLLDLTIPDPQSFPNAATKITMSVYGKDPITNAAIFLGMGVSGTVGRGDWAEVIFPNPIGLNVGSIYRLEFISTDESFGIAGSQDGSGYSGGTAFLNSSPIGGADFAFETFGADPVTTASTPLPAAVWGGMALFGALGLKRVRRGRAASL